MSTAPVPVPAQRFPLSELQELWPELDAQERAGWFRSLDQSQADAFFLDLGAEGQASLLLALPANERRLWLRLLAPDDAADLLQEVDVSVRGALLDLLDEPTRREVTGLLAYAEDAAGGLMSPRFARLRPEMTVDEAIAYLRRQARAQLETIYYAYVLDADQRLLGVVSFRELFAAPGDRPIREVMTTSVNSVSDDLDQEIVARLMAKHGYMAVPVLDRDGVMRGIVTVDDIVDVVDEEATEDIQKLGGMAALDTSYLETPLLAMVKKRAGWLAVLFVGEMLTTHAMAQFESQLSRAVVLAVFVPLIIASGGNSGSQAATLVIRAMALGEVRLRDWTRIIRRELAAGVALGGILAALGLSRVVMAEWWFGTYGPHANALAATVALSLIGVVVWGTLIGSMLPFIIRRVGFDPASASAPFVATLVDVVGLVLYFEIAQLILVGRLL